MTSLPWYDKMSVSDDNDTIGIGPEDEWNIVCTKERFAFLIEQDFFPLLVALARAVNGIRFCLAAGVASSEADGPSMRRGRTQAFFHVAAHLYEILDLVSKLESSFANLEAFGAKLLPLVQDSATVALRENELRLIRNRLTFHAADTTALREGLRKMARFPAEQHVFAVARGWKAADVYYLIGDVAAQVFVIGGESSEYRTKVEALVEQVINLATKIVAALDDVIAEVFNHPERLVPPLSPATANGPKDSVTEDEV